MIRFSAKIEKINETTLLRLPKDASAKLPSRGQVAVTGTVSGHNFQTVLEPDGRWGHWIRLDDNLLKATGLKVGDGANLEIETIKDWPEPIMPEDFAKALKAAPQKVKDKWEDITPMARWEWIRWVNATGSADTRAIRIVKSISKMNGKHRRPCCFNLAACTDPTVSKSGILLESE